MNSNEGSPKLLISDTAIPDIFFVQYMQDLTKEAICVYLRIACDAKSSAYTKKQIADISGFSAEVSDTAVAELMAADLLVTEQGKTFKLADIKLREVDEYCKNRMALGIDTEQYAIDPHNEERDALANSISKSLYAGKMPFVMYRLIDTCLFEYEYEPVVVYGLFNAGEKRKILNSPRYMKEMAFEWKNSGVTTQAKLNAMLEKDKRVDELTKMMGKLTRRRLNGIDLERISRWVETFDVTAQMVEYAFRCNEYKGNITLKDVEDKLEKVDCRRCKELRSGSLVRKGKREA